MDRKPLPTVAAGTGVDGRAEIVARLVEQVPVDPLGERGPENQGGSRLGLALANATDHVVQRRSDAERH